MILVGLLAGASLAVGCGAAGYLWYKRTSSLSSEKNSAPVSELYDVLPSGHILSSFNYEHRHERDYGLSYISRKSCYSYQDEPLDYLRDVVAACFDVFDERYYSKKKAQESSLSDAEIREMWHAENEEAQRVGAFMHRQLNNMLLDKYYQFSMTYSYVGEYTKVSKMITIVDEANQFNEFLKENELRPYRSMWVIYDEVSRLVGTIDLLALNAAGQHVMFNWTRSHTLGEETADGFLVNNESYGNTGKGAFRHVPDSPFHREALQMSVLRLILLQKYGIDVVSAQTAVFHSDNMKYHLIDLPFMRDEAENLLSRPIK